MDWIHDPVLRRWLEERGAKWECSGELRNAGVHQFSIRLRPEAATAERLLASHLAAGAVGQVVCGADFRENVRELGVVVSGALHVEASSGMGMGTFGPGEVFEAGEGLAVTAFVRSTVGWYGRVEVEEAASEHYLVALALLEWERSRRE